MKIQVVSYYTPTYSKEVKRLRASCAKCEITPYLHPMPDQGSWTLNVMAKPAFILGCLNAFKAVDGIFYTDADSEFLSIPKWDDLFGDCHISYHKFQRTKHHEIEHLSGSIYLMNSPTVKRFVSEWCENTRNREHSSTPEQDSLKATMGKWTDKISWKDCGPENCFIFDDFKAIYPGVKPVVLHHQASRRLRK